jgi:O-antigen/teichoic acid export membrane protein
LASNVLSKVISFATLSFLARVLRPEQLGFYNAVQNAGNSVNMMSSLGTPIVIQRSGAQIEKLGNKAISEKFSNALCLYLLINVLMAGVLLIWPGFFFEFLLDQKGEMQFVYLIAGLVFFNALAQMPLNLLLGLHAFRQFALRNLASTLLILTCSMILVYLMADNLQAAIYSLILAFLFNSIITWGFLLPLVRKHRIRIYFSLRLQVLRDIFSQGFLFFLGNTFLPAVSNLVIISLFYKYLTSSEYGYIRIGTALESLLTIIPAALQPVTISMLSRESDRHEQLKSFQIRVIPFLAILMFIVITFNLPMLMQLLFGANYTGAAGMVYWMILIQIPFMYLGLMNNYQVGKGHLNFIGITAVMGCLCLIFGSWWLIPRLGMTGYFVAQYLATALALLAVGLREYREEGKLSRADINSMGLTVILLGLSYFVFWNAHEYLRIPLTILTLLVACWIFWKTALSKFEREKLLRELLTQRQKILEATRHSS